MRLLSLHLEGFMPYRTPQSLDFRDIDLFALVGPTGSGKSALLDAITFALYGKAPRWPEKLGAGKLISQGLSRMSVTLEFRSGGQEYQVVRSARGKSAPEAQLRRRVEGEWKPLSGERRTTSEVNEDVERVVGMDYATFTRTLMLPQGQFDRLLKPATPMERKTLLIQLAGLDVYDRVADRLSLRMKTLEGELHHLSGALAQYEDLHPDQLSQLELKKAELEQRRAEVLVEQQTSLRGLESLRQDWQLWEQRQRVDLELQPLLQRGPEFERLAERIQRSRQVEGQRGPLQHLDRLRQRRAAIESEWLESEQRLQLLESQQAELQPVWESARQEAEQIPALDERIRELAALEESARTLSELLEEQRQLPLEPLEQQQQQLERELQQALESGQRLQSQWNELQQLPTEVESLQQQLELALRVESEAQRRHQLQLRHTQALAACEAGSQLLGGLEQELNQARVEFDRAQHLLQQQESERSAQVLRRQLAPRCPCPVCLQTVRELPLDLHLEEGDWLAAREAVEQARRLTENLEERIRQGQMQLAADSRGLQQVEADLAALTPGEELAGVTSEALRSELRQRQQHQADQRRCEQQLQQADSLKQLCAERLHSLKDRLAQQRLRREDLASKIEGRRKPLVEAFGPVEDLPGEVARQRELARARVQRLQQDWNQAEKQSRELGLELERRRAKHSLLSEQGEQHRNDCLQLESQLARSIAEAGLRDEEELRSLLLSADELDSLVRQLEEHRQHCARLQATLSQLDQALQGRQPSRQALEQAEAEQSRLLSALQHLDVESGGVQQELANLTHRLQQWEQVQEKHRELKRRFALHGQLNQLTSAKQLKAFVANQLLADILRLASQELERLSGRYQLVLQGEDIYVLDGWNAGEARDVRSLSGGETFLASLSLALAMVDYLSQGSPLESLFIDEGFGTLDPETLEAVTQVLEQLQEKGRLVGIITHVADLAERLPVQIRVEKRQGSSCVLSPSSAP